MAYSEVALSWLFKHHIGKLLQEINNLQYTSCLKGYHRIQYYTDFKKKTEVHSHILLQFSSK